MEIEKLYHQAYELWLNRTTTEVSPSDEAYVLLYSIRGQSLDPILNYDIEILLCQIIFFRYQYGPTGADASCATELIDLANSAMVSQDSLAEGYYYYAMGMYLNYTFNSPSPNLNPQNKNLLFQLLDEVMMRVTHTNQPGIEYDGYGSSRIKTEFLYSLMTDDNLSEALKLIEYAYNHAKNHSENILAYSKVLRRSGDKTMSKQLLMDFEKEDPNTINISRIPETKKDQEHVRQILAGLGNQSFLEVTHG